MPGKLRRNFLLKGIDGKIYSLEELWRKGPVLAAFFKISCPVCQFTFPFLQRLYERYGGDDVTFLGISQDDAKATAGFAKQYGIMFPIAWTKKRRAIRLPMRMAHECSNHLPDRWRWNSQYQQHGIREERFGADRCAAGGAAKRSLPRRCFARMSRFPRIALVEGQKIRSGRA